MPPRTSRFGLVAFLFLGLLAACSDLGSGPSAAPEGPVESVVVTSALQTCARGTFGNYFEALWDCSSTVRVYGDTPFLAARIGAPLSSWSSGLAATGVNGPPSFVTTETALQANITVTGVSGGTTFCGDYGGTTLRVFDASTSDCDNYNNKGILADLLRHEFAHAVGWAGQGHIGHNGGVSGVSDHCALALPPAGGFNTAICHHNIEGVLAGYDLRALPSTGYWETPFVVSHNGPGSFTPVSLQAGSTHSLTLGAFNKERGGTVAASWLTPSSNTSVATMFGGVITAHAPGSATFTVTPSQGSGYFLTSQFAASSRTVQVTVTAPQLAPLVVQDIAINTSLPITVSNIHGWTAVIGAGDTTGMSFRWVFEYSDNSPPDSLFIPTRQPGDPGSPWIKPIHPDSTYVGAPRTTWQLAHSGDYTIRVKVWPIRDGVAGSPATREFPVCTSGGGGGGGGNNLMALSEKPKKVAPPPPETEAVEGCA